MKNKRFTLILVMLLISSFFLQSIPTSVLAMDMTNSEEQETVALEGVEPSAIEDIPGSQTVDDELIEVSGSISAPSTHTESSEPDLNRLNNNLLEGEPSGNGGSAIQSQSPEDDENSTDQLEELGSNLSEEVELEETIQINFNTRGGSSLEPILVEKGSTVFELPSPSMEGFIFKGWFINKNEDVKLPFSPDGDITLYAEWDILPTNPDNLLEPDDSPYGGAIDYNVFPATLFSSIVALRNRSGSHPTEPGEVKLFKDAVPVDGMVNTWDVTLRIEGKNKPTTSDIILVIDTSGSMNNEGRMNAAKVAANAFINTLLPSDTTRIGIVSFAGEVTVKSQLTNNATSLNKIGRAHV